MPHPTPQGLRTRQRIIEAGADLLHGFPIWNWSALTVPAVAARAGVAERTVYRHFQSERGLRDAVMVHLEHEANVTMDGLRLENVAEVASRILEHSSRFPLVPRTQRDPTVAATNAKQRHALLAAVEPHTGSWSRDDRTVAAAILDLLWSVVGYERLVSDWNLEPQDAIRGTAWAIRLIEEAIRSDRPPAHPGR
ncbi:TetR/AcrR family transcriptional regulator [Frankia nepalensis]|uniref:TetR/AcrR family transcriptional regulator n=1 Tax=Frankia nepalensis TaxID=1836974 RepID=UPI002B1BD7F1|nr:helix-turn-helix domain-containing protein [Frankia nepalensis]